MYLLIILLFVLFYLYTMKPNSIRNEEIWKHYDHQAICHRGYFNDAIPENSLPAFKRAVKHHMGIELDVQMTTDGKLVVFHDATLKRMCHAKKTLHQMSYLETQQYTLNDSKEKIPLFEDVLKIVDGKVPLIVEIKSEGNYKETTKQAVKMLKGYKGIYIMESFHPGIVFYLRKHYPHILRGQLSKNHFIKRKENHIVAWLLSSCMANFLTKPDFIAYDINGKDFIGYRIIEKLFHYKKACWTIKSQEMMDEAFKRFDICIFDSFEPAKK